MDGGVADGGKPAAPPASGAAAALREDKVEQGTRFFGHPSVKGMSEDSLRQFLRSKGLTEAEIDEVRLAPRPW